MSYDMHGYRQTTALKKYILNLFSNYFWIYLQYWMDLMKVFSYVYARLIESEKVRWLHQQSRHSPSYVWNPKPYKIKMKFKWRSLPMPNLKCNAIFNLFIGLHECKVGLFSRICRMTLIVHTFTVSTINNSVVCSLNLLTALMCLFLLGIHHPSAVIRKLIHFFWCELWVMTYWIRDMCRCTTLHPLIPLFDI